MVSITNSHYLGIYSNYGGVAIIPSVSLELSVCEANKLGKGFHSSVVESYRTPRGVSRPMDWFAKPWMIQGLGTFFTRDPHSLQVVQTLL